MPAGKTIIGKTDCFDPAEVPDYFYVNGNNMTPCRSNCKRCTTATNCQLCGSYSNPSYAYYVYHASATSDYCYSEASCSVASNRHIVPGGSPPTCHQCQSGEYYTEGSNPPECTQCNTGAVWKDTSKRLCKPCGSGCSSCTSDTSCQTCTNSAHRVQVDGGTCAAGCQARQMTITGPPLACQACSSNCAACSEGVGCTTCDQGYYKDGSNNCQQCPTGCATCLSNTECLTCTNSGHFLGTDLVTCSPNCGSNEYKDNANKKCKACTSIANCLTCDISGQCTNCANGFFENSGACPACPTGCATCTRLTSCQSCTNGAHFLGTNGFTCSANCGSNEYKDTTNKKCVACTSIANCLTCDISGQCTNCADGFFEDSGTCSSCPSGCATCTSLTSCQSCSDQSHFLGTNQLTCSTNCLTNEYKDTTNKKCVACTSISNCLSCNINGQCTNCASGFFVEAGACTACPTQCKECDSLSVCRSCKNTLHFLGTNKLTCSVDCLDREYKDTTNKECKACTPNCKVCDETNGCTNCDDGFYESSGVCSACPNQCSLCVSSTECLSCKNGQHYLGTDKLTCSTDCLDRQFKDSNEMKCVDCSENCLTCTGINKCTECSSKFFLENGGCTSCPVQCAECTSLSICQSCQDAALFLQTDQLSCGADCPLREYKDTTSMKCAACPTNCKECLDQNSCQKCESNAFKDEKGECVLCPSQCSECKSLTECTSCQDPSNFLQMDKLTCLTSCQDREYGDPDTKHCTPCDKDCLECNKKGCLKCKDNLALVSNECKSTNIVDFALKQFFDPKSKYVFTLEVLLEDQQGLPDLVYAEFEKSMLDYKNKFKVVKKDTGEQLSFKIFKTSTKNKFKMKVNFTSLVKLNLGDKHLIAIESKSESLDPTFVDKTGYHNLIAKKAEYEIEILKTGEKPLTPSVAAVANFAGSSEAAATPAATAAGVVMTAASNDPNGVFLKFTQYLNFLKRAKMVGAFLGVSLEEFIESLSTGEKTEDDEEEEGDQSRLLELSLQSNRKHQIESSSKGSYAKLDKFQVSIFFQGPLMIKSILYDISWVLKLVGLILMSGMKKTNKAVKWKLSYLKYQRKLHFILVMSGAMDTYFFGTRIILHRNNGAVDLLVKAVLAVNMTLITLDMLEIMVVSLGVQYKPKNEGKGKSDNKKGSQEEILSGCDQIQSLDSDQNRREVQLKKSRSSKKNNKKKNSRVHPSHQRPPVSHTNRKKRVLFDNLKRVDKIFGGKKKRNRRRPPTPLQRSGLSESAFGLNANESKNKQDLNRSNGTNQALNILNTKRKKLFVDHRRTIQYNQRNLEIENFASSMLRDDPKAYTSTLCLLSNSFNVIQLILFQILIPALPHAPSVLLFLLALVEAIFMALALIPFITVTRFISWLNLAEKTLKFIFMEGFFLTCLVISIKNNGQRKPVSKKLQSLGIVMVLGGMVITYLFTFIKITVLVVKSVAGLLKKKKKDVTTVEKEYLSQRGLIFYTEKEQGQEEQGEEDFDEKDEKKSLEKKEEQIEEKPIFRVDVGEEEEEEKVGHHPKEKEECFGGGDPFDFLNSNTSKQTQKRNRTQPKSFGVRDLRQRGVSWHGLYHALAKRLQGKSKGSSKRSRSDNVPKKQKNHSSKRSSSRQKNKQKSRRRHHRSLKRDRSPHKA